MENTWTLMIADEDKNVISNIENVFTKDKFNIIGYATNGESLLEVLKQKVPDILIMELVLPKVDGFEVLEYKKGKFKNSRDY